jgi:hypothetical protein
VKKIRKKNKNDNKVSMKTLRKMPLGKSKRRWKDNKTLIRYTQGPWMNQTGSRRKLMAGFILDRDINIMVS